MSQKNIKIYERTIFIFIQFFLYVLHPFRTKDHGYPHLSLMALSSISPFAKTLVHVTPSILTSLSEKWLADFPYIHAVFPATLIFCKSSFLIECLKNFRCLFPVLSMCSCCFHLFYNFFIAYSLLP